MGFKLIQYCCSRHNDALTLGLAHQVVADSGVAESAASALRRLFDLSTEAEGNHSCTLASKE